MDFFKSCTYGFFELFLFFFTLLTLQIIAGPFKAGKAPDVRTGASRQFIAGGPGRIVKKYECVHTYPDSATDQTRTWAKSDNGVSRLCYSLRRYIPGVASAALRCVPINHDSSPDIGHGVSWCFYGKSRK